MHYLMPKMPTVGLWAFCLGSIALLLTGCGSNSLSPSSFEEIDLAPFEQAICTPKGPSIIGLTPANPVDYLEFRHWYRVYAPGTNPQTSTTVVEASGTSCATASDQAKCQSDLAKLTVSEGLHTGGRNGLWIEYSYLVTTQGDEVKSVSTLPAVKQFLMPIDAPQEALFTAWANGYQIGCTDKKHGAVRSVPDGYQVLAVRNPYPWSDFYEVLLHVSSSGQITEILSQKFQRP